MKTIQIVLFSFVLLCFVSTDVLAFRCGSGLITSGASKVQVTTTCGKPTSKEKACEGRQASTRTDKDGKVKKYKKCANKVDIWYYNCGDNDYIYALTFENGKLTKESNEGRGKGRSDCLGK
ncbi:MAG: DUF2845 domain-containing protein [Smithella sp.]|jgi:hypothetical protein